MKFTLEIEDRLVPVLDEYLRSLQQPDDDGMSDVIIIENSGCSVKDLVKTGRLYGEFTNAVRKAARGIKRGKR